MDPLLHLTDDDGRLKFVKDYVSQQAQIRPHAIAVQFGTEELTYAALDEQSTRLAIAIYQDASVGDIVGFSTSKSLELIIGIVAILKAGKTYLPLDPTYPVSRLQSIILDAQVSHCICLKQENHFFETIGVSTIDVSTHPSDGAASLSVEHIEPIYVLYTSGSTGKPKGVVLGNDALANLINWQNDHSNADHSSKTLQLSPLTFDPSFLEIFATFSKGGTLVLVDDDIRLDPERLIQFINEQSINRIYLPYVALQYLTDAAIQHQIFPAALQEVITAGEALKVTQQIIQFFTALPNAILYNQYGPTESHVCTALTLTGHPSTWPYLPTIGIPVYQTDIYIVDEKGQLLPKGTEGELYIAGVCLAEGYLNAPELTEAKFIHWTHPTKGSIRVYKSGDLAIEQADGNFQFLGRIDDQIKVRGYRVEPGEIEVALSYLPGIQQAIVVADEDANQQKRLVAYLQALGTKPSLADIREQLVQSLPDFMIPSIFEWIDVIPKTSSGKIDKKALPKPNMERPMLNTIFIEPETANEQSIAAIWRTILNWNKIGTQDNFFALGGNSLLAMKANAAFKNAFAVHVPISTFYRNPTISALAQLLTGDQQQLSIKRRVPIAQQSTDDHDIAIIGMHGQFPGADSIEAFWRVLVEGQETISFFSKEDLDPSIPKDITQQPAYIAARGIINDVEYFDANFFGIPPAQASLMDPQQRVFLEMAWALLEQYGYTYGCYDGSVGVFAGTGNNTYYLKNVLSNKDKVLASGEFSVMTLNEKDYVASRTAYTLNLNGPAVSLYSACSTSLLAIAQAVQSIRDNRCDIAIAGGIAITAPVKSGHLYQEGAMYSNDGHTRPFDAAANGTVFSDGGGVVLLKRKTDAIKDGDFIYACIKGIGINNDGFDKSSFTAPSVIGQAGVIDQAIADANLSPNQIAYVETHGTATPLGDPIELEGLKLAFGAGLPKQACAIGSVKSNIGHLTAAAGVAGLIKTALMFQHKQLVPTIHFENANPELNIEDSPFYVPTTVQALPTNTTLYGGVSSFGVGGTNVHVVLSSYNNPIVESDPCTFPVLICLSAKSLESLHLNIKNLLQYLETNRSVNLADLAYTLQCCRTHFSFRYFFVAHSYDELVSLLFEYINGIETPGNQDPLAKIGLDWVEGRWHDFSGLHSLSKRKKLIDLPTYGFNKKYHWIEPMLSVAEPIETIQPDETVNQIEEQLKHIIIDVSGEEESLITPEANFLSIGLDSLVLTQLAIQFSKAFDVPISFRLLNEELDCINAVANYIRANQVSKAVVVEAPKETTVVALSEDEQKELAKPFGAIAKIERTAAVLQSEQLAFIKQFTEAYNQKTKASKDYTANYRLVMADPRVVSGFKPLIKETIYPIVVKQSSGARLWDIDGNEYIDALNGFGSNMLGYQNAILKKAVQAQVEAGYEIGPQHVHAGEVCQMICSLTQNDRAALCNTGSEAVLGAIRIARTVTGRSLIVAFNGSYHGINDEVIVRGSKRQQSFPAAPGILPESVANILVLDYGTPETLQIIASRAHELAAVLVEPVQSRRPEFQPIEFLKQVRMITQASGTALIFDEVITGFRAHPGGVQHLFDIKADLTTYGKILGGGMPIGAIAGSTKWMDALDGGHWEYGDQSVPEIGVTYFAGTFVRHPLALAAAKASLTLFESSGPSITESLTDLTTALANGINAVSTKYNLPYYVVHFASLWKIKMKEELPYAEIIFTMMRHKGIHIWDGFPCFLTTAHTKEDIQTIINVFETAAMEMRSAGFFGNQLNNIHTGQPIVRSFPMIPPQEEIWMSCEIGGEDANRAYNESISLQFNGHLNHTALQAAIAQLMQRHESLRTVINTANVQLVVYETLMPPIRLEDLSTLDDQAQSDFIQAFLKQDANTAFDLANGPLWRVAYFQLSANKGYLCISAHHIIADGWSLGHLLLELSILYTAHLHQTTPNIGDALLFSDYAKQTNSFIQTSAYKNATAYWMNKLSNLGAPFVLPTDFERPTIRTYQSNRLDFPLSEHSMRNLANMGASVGCSLVTTLLACFEVLMYKLTYADQIVIGLPAAGQPVSGFNTLIGHCVNLMPLVSQPNSQTVFISYLKDRKKAILNDYEHQQVSFGSLIKQLPNQRQASSVPLVPIVLNIDIDFDKGVNFDGLDYELFYNPRAFETFEIFLNISGGNGKYTMEWSYNTALFSERTITQMMQRFEQLIQSVVLNPQTTIGQLATVDQEQVLLALAPINQNKLVYPDHKTVIQLFEEQVLAHPNAVALRYEAADYTYQQLNERANQIAHCLNQRGVQQGAVVGLYVNRSMDMIAAVLGIYKSGAALLTLDPDHPTQRIASLTEKAGVVCVVTETDLTSALPNQLPTLLLSDTIDANHHNPAHQLSTDATSFILYTSGSTGEPKGVMLTHKGLTNVILGLQKTIGFTNVDKLLFVTTIIFDLAQADIFLPLVSGGELVLTSKEASKDGFKLLELIKQHGITYLEATPVTYKFMLATGWTEKLNMQLTCCGEPLSVDLATALKARCNKLYNMYGPTECTIYATASVIEQPELGISIGYPFPNTQVYILDQDQMILPPGFVGELYIAGDGVAKGYLNDAALTKAKFLPNPFSSDANATMYRSGDLAKINPDGSIAFFGRKDSQVKIRGLRIEMGEIEYHLRQLPGVKDAVVIVRDDIGYDQQSIVAYIVGDDQLAEPLNTLVVHQWRDQLGAVLPNYYIPNFFVSLKALPLTSSGKLNRNQLPKPDLNTLPIHDAPEALTPLQTQLTSIWKELLGLTFIGAHDDFFELGGHSLIAIQVMTRIKKETGIQIPISALFQYPTIQSLSRLIETNAQQNFSCLVPIKPSGTKPPLFLIHGDGLNVLVFKSFSKYISADQPVWGIQSKGLDGQSLPDNTIEAIAKDYLKEILILFPDGPYNFAGYSFGGLVAYELAKQLKAMGKQVNFVGILDTNISNEQFYLAGMDRLPQKLKRQLLKLAFIGKSFVRDPKATIAYQQFIIQRKTSELLVKFGIKQATLEEQNLSHEGMILQNLTHAYKHYNMQSQDLLIDLFRCKTRPYFVNDQVYLGWKKFAEKGVIITEVPGDHETFLYSPNDVVFAKAIESVMQLRNQTNP
jgi:amino acid adenylation domain-containing protein